eukprot:COSAG01_NODE_2504_length_7555_cov_3.189646_5_plen_174_part_00
MQWRCQRHRRASICGRCLRGREGECGLLPRADRRRRRPRRLRLRRRPSGSASIRAPAPGERIACAWWQRRRWPRRGRRDLDRGRRSVDVHPILFGLSTAGSAASLAASSAEQCSRRQTPPCRCQLCPAPALVVLVWAAGCEGVRASQRTRQSTAGDEAAAAAAGRGVPYGHWC